MINWSMTARLFLASLVLVSVAVCLGDEEQAKEPDPNNRMAVFDCTVDDGLAAGSLDFPHQPVTLNNWHQDCHIKWTIPRLSIRPSMMISRGGQIHEFPKAVVAGIESVEFEFMGESTTVLEALESIYTDGIVVIKDGQIAYERYFGDFDEDTHHAWGSATKSVTGVAMAILIGEGKISLSKTPAEYISALKGSAYEHITIRQLVDMNSSLDYEESGEWMTPGHMTFDYFKRVGLIPNLDVWSMSPDEATVPRGIRGLLPQLQVHPTLQQGFRFKYQNPNVEVAGWLVESVSGQPFQDFLQDRIWKKLGAEHDALTFTDPTFVPIASGGLSSTLRDAARFGMLVLSGGKWLDEQVVPEHAIDDIFDITNEDIEAYRQGAVASGSDAMLAIGKAYKNFFWVTDPEAGVISASGVWGQRVYIDKSRNTVIAVFSSHPVASESFAGGMKRLQTLAAIAESL